VTFYVDAKQLGETVGAGATFHSGLDALKVTRIGVGNDCMGGIWNGDYNGSFGGDIDELYVNYGEAKTQAFITKLMNKGVAGIVRK